MALAAGHSSIAALIVMERFRLVALGAAVGLAASVLLAQLLSSMLYRVKPADLKTLGLTILLMGVTTILAVLLRALRSARVPMQALRTES
jgi:predicted lysophospholipase L1 biosynthesis ABC-type transport system permease subunit